MTDGSRQSEAERQTLVTGDVEERLMSMVNPRSRTTGEVSMSWPHTLTRVNDVGVRRLDEWMTIACDLLSSFTSSL